MLRTFLNVGNYITFRIVENVLTSIFVKSLLTCRLWRIFWDVGNFLPLEMLRIFWDVGNFLPFQLLRTFLDVGNFFTFRIVENFLAAEKVPSQLRSDVSVHLETLLWSITATIFASSLRFGHNKLECLSTNTFLTLNVKDIRTGICSYL